MNWRQRLSSGWLPVYATAYVIFLYLPALLLPIFSVNSSAVPKFPMTGFTWKWWVMASTRRTTGSLSTAARMTL